MDNSEEKNVSTKDSKTPGIENLEKNVFFLWLIIAFLILTSIIIGFFFMRRKKESEKYISPVRVDDRGNPLPDVAGVPTPESIVKCDKGPYPEVPGVLKLSEERGWHFGVVVDKSDTGEMVVTVQQIYDDSLADVFLDDVDKIEFREIIDGEGYLKGDIDSFKHVQFDNGKPYTMKDYFEYLPIGAHIWVLGNEEEKVIQIYCDVI